MLYKRANFQRVKKCRLQIPLVFENLYTIQNTNKLTAHIDLSLYAPVLKHKERNYAPSKQLTIIGKSRHHNGYHAHKLMSILSEGPAVSLNGSPRISHNGSL
jgi:hypothetical protein